MRVSFDSIEHDDYTDAQHQGRAFTGTAFDLVNGRLAEECDFVDGSIHGMRREYYSGGRTRWEASYADGDMHGPCVTYFEDGRIQARAVYVFGELLESEEFTEDGVRVSEYRRDSGILREWRSDGSLRKETTCGAAGGHSPSQVAEERFYDNQGKPTLVHKRGSWRIAGGKGDA